MCLIQKLRFRPVRQEEYGEPVGALAGLLSASGSRTSLDFSDEMLVLCNFTESALNTFILGFRKAGITPVHLKAVLTPTNAGWNSIQLHDELKQEHAAMSGK